MNVCMREGMFIMSKRLMLLKQQKIEINGNVKYSNITTTTANHRKNRSGEKEREREGG